MLDSISNRLSKDALKFYNHLVSRYGREKVEEALGYTGYNSSVMSVQALMRITGLSACQVLDTYSSCIDLIDEIMREYDPVRIANHLKWTQEVFKMWKEENK